MWSLGTFTTVLEFRFWTVVGNREITQDVDAGQNFLIPEVRLTIRHGD